MCAEPPKTMTPGATLAVMVGAGTTCCRFTLIRKPMKHFSGPLHGTSGPVRIGSLRYGFPTSKAFVKAGQEAGLPFNPDFNGVQQEGVGYFQVTATDGTRSSAATSFLRRLPGGETVTVRTHVHLCRASSRRSCRQYLCTPYAD